MTNTSDYLKIPPNKSLTERPSRAESCRIGDLGRDEEEVVAQMRPDLGCCILLMAQGQCRRRKTFYQGSMRPFQSSPVME
jgi:hypothetical protein